MSAPIPVPGKWLGVSPTPAVETCEIPPARTRRFRYYGTGGHVSGQQSPQELPGSLRSTQRTHVSQRLGASGPLVTPGEAAAPLAYGAFRISPRGTMLHRPLGIELYNAK